MVHGNFGLLTFKQAFFIYLKFQTILVQRGRFDAAECGHLQLCLLLHVPLLEEVGWGFRKAERSKRSALRVHRGY